MIPGRAGHAGMAPIAWEEGGPVNAIEKVPLVLEAVREQRSALSVERVVIDSRSGDGSDDAARRAGFRVLSVDPRTFNGTAAYAFHIAENQPFIDGNKRAALLSALNFLALNGIKSDEPVDAFYDALIALAEKRLDKPGLAAALMSAVALLLWAVFDAPGGPRWIALPFALFYSLLESAKLAGVDPAAYLAEATRRAGAVAAATGIGLFALFLCLI